jgi:hypothetical protein
MNVPPTPALSFAPRRALAVWGLVGACSAGALLLLWLLPAAGLGLPMCLLRAATGVPCPGCGLTRAFTALAHGDVASAWTYHPFAVLLSAQGALAWVLSAWPLLRGRPLRVRSVLIERALLWNGIGLLALWLGRAATGTLP